MSPMSQALLPLVSASVCLLFLGTYSMKDVLDSVAGGEMFYGSPAQIAKKYKLSMYAQPWAGSTIRPLAMLWNIAGMIYILCKVLNGKPNREIPKSFFHFWSTAWITTTFWVFVFDREFHVMATTANFAVFVSFCLALIAGNKFYVDQNRNEDEGKFFAVVVLEGLGIAAAWGFLAFAMSFALALAYKCSLHSEVANLTGLLSIEECSTIGLILNLLGFLVWWFFDVAYCGERTDSIRSIYVVFTLVSFSITLNNYDSDTGFSMNNMLSLTSAVVATFAFCTRKKAKVLLLGDCTSPTTKPHRE